MVKINQNLLMIFIAMVNPATMHGMSGKLNMVPFDYAQHHQVAQKMYDTYAVPAKITDPDARKFHLPSVLVNEPEMEQFRNMGPREASIFKVGDTIVGLAIYQTIGTNKLTINSLILEPRYEKQAAQAIEELEAMAQHRNVVAVSVEPSEKLKSSFTKRGFKPIAKDEDMLVKNITAGSSSSSSGWSKYNPFKRSE